MGTERVRAREACQPEELSSRRAEVAERRQRINESESLTGRRAD